MEPKKISSNGWNEYEKLVMYRLDTIASDVSDLAEKIDCVNGDVRDLKIKAGIWGAVAGSIPGVVMLLYILISKLLP